MSRKQTPLAAAAAIALSLATGVAQAAPTQLTEGFDNVDAVLASGWVIASLSAPVGSTFWYQGDASVFTAFAGADDAYIAANYNSSTAGGVISTWLITPDVEVGPAGGRLSFATRADAAPGYGDHLTVLFNGTGSLNLADFTTVLFNINGAEAAGGYPTDWTRFATEFQGPGLSHGRLAFVYTQANADNANYVGLDSVEYAAIPEPESFGLALLALGGLAAFSRRRTHAAA